MITLTPKKQIILFIGDIFFIIVSFYLSTLLFFNDVNMQEFLNYKYLSAILIYLLFFFIFDYYDLDEQFQSVRHLFRFIVGLVVANLVIAALFYLFNARMLPHSVFLINIVMLMFLCIMWRLIFYWLLNRYQHALRFLIIGAGETGRDLYRLFENRIDYEVAGFLDDDHSMWGTTIGNAKILGGTNLLSNLIKEAKLDFVVTAITHDMSKGLYDNIIDITTNGFPVYDASTFCEKVLMRISVRHLNDLWIAYMPIYGVRKTIYNQKIRKIFEIFLSLFIIAVFSPVFFLIAVAIKLDSKGPIFYIQRRIGWRGKPFNLIKFRSMKVDLENSRNLSGQKYDSRITNIGKILRFFRFDEIPQFWNVIKGEMSIIGPRALMEEEVHKFETQIPYFSLRHSIKPGITGWAQINYPHGATVRDGFAKLEYDLYYMKNLSPLLDIVILLQTIRIVLFGDGAR